MSNNTIHSTSTTTSNGLIYSDNTSDICGTLEIAHEIETMENDLVVNADNKEINITKYLLYQIDNNADRYSMYKCGSFSFNNKQEEKQWLKKCLSDDLELSSEDKNDITKRILELS
jgi:hypothetical protein